MVPLNNQKFPSLSDWWWPLILSRKIVGHFLFPHLTPPGNWWYDVLGFVPAGSVSRSSTLQIFWDASHVWWLLCLPVYLLSHFPSPQGSTYTKVDVEHWHASLGFPFHIWHTQREHATVALLPPTLHMQSKYMSLNCSSAPPLLYTMHIQSHTHTQSENIPVIAGASGRFVMVDARNSTVTATTGACCSLSKARTTPSTHFWAISKDRLLKNYISWSSWWYYHNWLWVLTHTYKSIHSHTCAGTHAHTHTHARTHAHTHTDKGSLCNIHMHDTMHAGTKQSHQKLWNEADKRKKCGEWIYIIPMKPANQPANQSIKCSNWTHLYLTASMMLTIRPGSISIRVSLWVYWRSTKSRTPGGTSVVSVILLTGRSTRFSASRTLPSTASAHTRATTCHDREMALQALFSSGCGGFFHVGKDYGVCVCVCVCARARVFAFVQACMVCAHVCVDNNC